MTLKVKECVVVERMRGDTKSGTKERGLDLENDMD
jgi:hypothetical protein